MRLVIDMDDNLYTHLFDNGDDYAIDMEQACIAIRNGKPLFQMENDLICKILLEVDGGTDDKYINYLDICARVVQSVKEYFKEVKNNANSN